MGLLAAIQYDPATAVSHSTASLQTLTTFHSTDASFPHVPSFTVPASGTVWVRMRGVCSGSTSGGPNILLGIIDSTGPTTKMRVTPQASVTGLSLNAATQFAYEAIGVVTGLTPAATITTWDAAYGVEVVIASTNLSYGGPNDATGNDAWGAFTCEIWDTANLLGGILYDPASASSGTLTSLRVMAALDTTNLRQTVTAPASGNIAWRIRSCMTGASTSPAPSLMLGVMESSTVVARQAAFMSNPNAGTTFPYWVCDGSGVITGVGAGSHTYDAAWASQLTGGSANYRLKWGGPDDTTTNNAFGGVLFELWAA